MKRESPFLSHELQPLRRFDDPGIDLSRLLRESPFSQLDMEREAAAPEQWTDETRHGMPIDELEWEQPGCEGEEPEDVGTELFDAEAWSGSAEQIAFRDRVLTRHLELNQASGRPPQRDLADSELAQVPGTNIKSLPATAAAAGDLLAAANAALKLAQQAGDADALRTVRLTANSGYRGSAKQRSLWITYFSRKTDKGYYNLTQAARERIPQGPHSAQAVEYMLRPVRQGGFGIVDKIAAPGYSKHQGGIAIDFFQERIKHHAIENSTQAAARARWRNTWFYRWLQQNHQTYHFEQLPTEEWHWEYRPPGGAAAARTALPNRLPVMTREQVQFAQRVLNATEGERLSDDGAVGALTRAALTRFRNRHGLGNDAALDAATELALAQRALEELAQQSMFAQYGQRDARTEQALISFRTQRGLGMTGTLDAATRLALTDALARRRPAARTATPTATAHLDGKLWQFTARTLPLQVAVFVPKSALGRSDVEVLLYAHGLTGPCKGPKSFPGGFITDPPFRLGSIVAASGRPMVLVVPHLNWDAPGGAAAFGKGRDKWHALAQPATLNAFIAEVLAQVGSAQLRELIIAGHSRAYDFLEPLVHSRADPQMRQGALAKLTRVWAFDTTYTGNVDHWLDWLRRDARLQVACFYQPFKPDAKGVLTKLPSGTAKVGDAFYAKRSARLSVTRVSELHCNVPARQLPALLQVAPQVQEVAVEGLDDDAAGVPAEFTDGFDSADVGDEAEQVPDFEELDADLGETLFIDPMRAGAGGQSELAAFEADEHECGCRRSRT